LKFFWAKIFQNFLQKILIFLKFPKFSKIYQIFPKSSEFFEVFLLFQVVLRAMAP